MPADFLPCRLLFWNVNKSDLTALVCSLANTTDAAVVVLNESRAKQADTLAALKQHVSTDFFIPHSYSKTAERFHCYCRRRDLDVSEVHGGSRTSVRRFRIDAQDALLALVHGIDIRNNDPETRQSFAQTLADELRLAIREQETNKMVVLGDFNMNPYDRGMNLAAGLNAMMTRSCVARGIRTHIGKEYDFYYNPMWSLFGDNTDGPAGTIYDTGNQGPYGWSMLDQVLINHSLVERFHGVKILTDAGGVSLQDKSGRPDSKSASNHFPLLVSLGGANDE